MKKHCSRPRFGLCLAIALVSLLVCQLSDAGSATWNLNPTSNDWNTAANWTPMTIPNGTADIATFGVSSSTAVSISAKSEVASIVFNPGASAYTITTTDGPPNYLTISGAGIMNNSGVTQTIYSTPSPIFFQNSAVIGDMIFIAGDASFFNNAKAGAVTIVSSNGIGFSGTSSAQNADLTMLPDAFAGANISFGDTSTADHATITVEPEAPGAFGIPSIVFSDHSSAGNATLIVRGAISVDTISPQIDFEQKSDAANATVIAYGGGNGGHGGDIIFTGTPNGGTAKIQLFGNSLLDTTLTHGVEIGSVEGEGTVRLGASQLQVGTNNLSTAFSGAIGDDGEGGSFVKVGTGGLTLSGASTYAGVTTVKDGTLVVTNTAGSATGTGSVSVTAGTLGGGGTIAGAVTVGTGSGTSAFLAPAAGTTTQARLTIQSAVTLNSDATYTYTFKANKNNARTDLVIANGVTINNATITLSGNAGADEARHGADCH